MAIDHILIEQVPELAVYGSINPEDRALIEYARSVNKVLSIYVMALLDQCRPPTESQFSVAAMLTTLADDIRERTVAQAVNGQQGQHAARSTSACAGIAVSDQTSWPHGAARI